ncbi:MAG TPA: phosphotransferase [Clostridiales bacterium]|nr:phosphotransferase [Clostridiales bacterium]
MFKNSLSSENLKSILEAFSIKDFDEVLPIANGTANKNYLVVASPSLVIRERSSKYSSEEQMLFEEEYLNHVFSKGIPVPVPLKTLNHLCWYSCHNRVYQVYPFIGSNPGDNRDYNVGDGKGNCADSIEGDGENDYNGKNDVEEAGGFLGRLHSAVNGFTPQTLRNLPRYDDPSIIIHEVSRIIEKSINTITVEERKTLEYILEQAKLVNMHINDEVYYSLPKLLIHGDYHPANVKYMNGKISGLFDFDWVSLQPRIRDITDGIIYFSSKRNENLTGNNIFSLATGYIFDLEGMRLFIKGYSQNVSLPVLEEEIKNIPYFIRARLMHSRVQALKKIPEALSIKMLTEGMKHLLSWIDENQNRLIENLMD